MVLEVEFQTRNSAIADKPRDAFRGQSRSPTMVSFHMLCMVFQLVCYSNIVPKTCLFQIFDFKKCRDLEIWVRSHLRSLKVVPFDGLCMVSNYYLIVIFFR